MRIDSHSYNPRKIMKSASSKFLLAMLFAFSAQSFFLVARRQEITGGASEFLIVGAAVLLLLAGYFNLDLIFYSHSAQREKKVVFFSFFLIGTLGFLYWRAALWVEGVALFFVGVAYLFGGFGKTWREDYLKRAVAAANLFVSFGFFFFDGVLKTSPYAVLDAARVFWGGLFFAATFFALLFRFLPILLSFERFFAKLLALPWVIWAIVFLLRLELSKVIPAASIAVTLLTLGLIPFKKLRFPERGMLGSFVFPTLAIIEGVLLFLFFFLLRSVPASDYYKHDIVFVFSLFFGMLALYGVTKLHLVIYKLINTPMDMQGEKVQKTALEKFSERLFVPVREHLFLSEWQAKKIQSLSAELIKEREGAKRFSMLKKLRRQLDDQLDDPVVAQLAVNFLQEYFRIAIAVISVYDAKERELSFLASAGRKISAIPVGYRQSIDDGIMGRAARTRKTQIVNDTRQDKDYISLCEERNLAEIAHPLIYHGHLKGVLLLGAKVKDAFSPDDIPTLEAVTEELLRTWERTSYNRRLRTLIQANVSLSTLLNTQSVIEEVASIAQQTLQARFVFVTLFDQDGSFTRTSSRGNAPNLQKFLSKDLVANPLLQEALDAKKSFRVRDIRRYKHASSVRLDHKTLRGMIVAPIRLHGVNIGATLAFGKQEGVFFSEKDESLANLLSAQAAAAIESAWLIQELRSTSATTSALYQLSFGILQIDRIEDAAQLIAETAQRLASAPIAGIVLYSPEGAVETSLEVTSEKVNFNSPVPFSYVQQALATGESITISSEEEIARIYLPIQTSLQKYGVLWVEFTESKRRTSSRTQTLQTLANQAAMALERVMLLLDSRQKAVELIEAYNKLENTYDQTLLALMSALDARDRETEGHSARVTKTSELLGKELDLPLKQRQSLQRGSLLHDIGKIGISDAILNKAGKLTDEEWEVMRRHPVIGKEIIKDIPFLQDAIPVVYAHHERWNGSGYPLGLHGKDIPLEARIFAVADIFDALTSVRPYRKQISNTEALGYLQEQAGILLDPDVVAAFARLLERGEI
jgi:HD-GYP domain-containing protein (c-di-GMP phosphodiesterase class II)/putative methionine-R-sulfoxide reductase with GAF domain